MFRALTLFLFASIPFLNFANADIYGGTSLDYGIPHSGKERVHGSIIIGNRAETDNYFYGGEIDVGTNIDGVVDYATVRARILFGLSILKNSVIIIHTINKINQKAVK